MLQADDFLSILVNCGIVGFSLKRDRLKSPLGLELKNRCLSSGRRSSTSNGFMASAWANTLTRAGGDTGREEREVSDWSSFPQER